MRFDNPASFGERIILETEDVKKSFLRAEAAQSKDYPALLENYYKFATGETLNLEDPHSFNEKIQWLKLYDSTSTKTRLADKYLAREWISEKIGEEYLVPLLGVWDSFDEIDFDLLPDQFVLKCNHGSGWNLIVEDKNKIDLAEEKKKFDEWMDTNFAFVAGFELHYKDIPRKIIAEKYLGGAMIDYRFFCFNGIPVQVWVDLYSGTPAHVRSIFDMEWNKLDFRCTWPEGGPLLDRQPDNFEKMKDFSSRLSEGFAFVRVDFFEIDGQLFMGEMTFTPMSGLGNFYPPVWNKKMGDLLILPKKV